MIFSRGVYIVLFSFIFFTTKAQQWSASFEQLGSKLPTPNTYRTGSGAPGEAYWQQKVDYKIKVSIDDEKQVLTGTETITYHNNSPDVLTYLWVQLDQNVRKEGNIKDVTNITGIAPKMSTKNIVQELGAYDYDGGFKIGEIETTAGENLDYFINRTMMRINLPTPLKPGENFEFKMSWSYNLYDRMIINGRGGYEYFPEDKNYAYTVAQWYPRLCVYDDYEGWQNKQFIGDGEFALEFGDFDVEITVPADHIVSATGELQNATQVLSAEQQKRWTLAKKTFDKPVIIASQEEAEAREKNKSSETKSWHFKAQNVRDFAFATSRKYIWEAQAVKLPPNTVMAMSVYPKEANPLWANEATKAVKNALEVYSSRTFDYPYPVAIAVNAANQGMEYPMICFNGSRPNKNGKYSQRHVSDLVDVVVHEVGHNYFPMIVNTDERMYGWMDEGLNTFLELETKRERYPTLDTIWGSPKSMTVYHIRFDQWLDAPMTNPDITNFSDYSDYGQASAAMNVLRNVIMGKELFDMAFKTYANLWKFKRPKPADFFRVMEDASATDLDWFWKGWFFKTTPVDVAIENVKWYRLRDDNFQPKQKYGILPKYFSLTETPDIFYWDFLSRVDDEKIKADFKGKNFYDITFKNVGGLVSPLVLQFTFDDNTTASETIPAEIWRYSESEVTKVFYFNKVLKSVQLDPFDKTGDINTRNNVFKLN
ncbi:M1 family metallopeptidase [Fulvivirga sp.]|uniref:M1 family metallopeptidase n=1 Tax=Fulvivirga sp. TaxID=1931237 RepID=UPI0032EFA00F